ncbi:MAG: amidohydrolase family protein [Terriglobia bacterium]
MISRRKFLKTQAAGLAVPFALSASGAKASPQEGVPASAGSTDPLPGQPKIFDCHNHYNGDPAYADRLAALLESMDGMAFLLVHPDDLKSAKKAVAKHPDRLMGLGSPSLDDPQAVALVDQFHEAGFRGLGELEYPRKNYDDPSYWPVYERAQKYGMVVLFHTGIVDRVNPEIPSDVSVSRMEVTRLDLIARLFPRIHIIGAHCGNPDYHWAGETWRWNPNELFDLSGSSLLKKKNDPTFFKSVFWWTGLVSPHTPKSGASAFEKLVFSSDCFGGDLGELKAGPGRYRRMLDACGVSAESQANIFSGTIWRILQNQKM